MTEQQDAFLQRLYEVHSLTAAIWHCARAECQSNELADTALYGCAQMAAKLAGDLPEAFELLVPLMAERDAEKGAA